MNMDLPYTKEIIKNPQGIDCPVLNASKVDFKNALVARKSTLTLVKEARGGEKIETKNSTGKIESVYEAQKGEAIFVNIHNPKDMYVPGNSDGSRWQFKNVLNLGYEKAGNAEDGMWVKSTNTAKVLIETVTEPLCIKDAWGKGNHQFLYPGATLKQDPATQKVTGIDKEAFEATWEIIPSFFVMPSKSVRTNR
ncbi:MAG: hypothetical protein LBU87_00660 [Lactobacillales bacterium]|jgi:hypothetical protein|nr:hypothetical protein [Lactobacillales bacterium]